MYSQRLNGCVSFVAGERGGGAIGSGVDGRDTGPARGAAVLRGAGGEQNKGVRSLASKSSTLFSVRFNSVLCKQQDAKTQFVAL